MIPVLTPDQARRADAAAGVNIEVLIERAGAAVARSAIDMLGGAYARTVVVLAGPGMNGADGRVAARHLTAAGCRVKVVDALNAPDDVADLFSRSDAGCDLVIDAAFGTGARAGWMPPAVEGVPVLAVDLPSGLDPMTGEGDAVLRADVTVTFAASKPGLHLGIGPDVAGRIEVVDIGLNPLPDGAEPYAWLVTGADVAAWWPRRARTAHKWSAAVRVVAGGPGMRGAAQLAASAALRAGAGMVRLSSPGAPDGDSAPIEAVHESLPTDGWAAQVFEDLHRFGSLVVGPGLGRADATAAEAARVVFDSGLPAVVDGDGLFALSWNPHGAPGSLRARGAAVVLTPHAGEFATLTGSAPGADPIAAANALVAETGAVVLLKGPTTVVAGPDGRTYLVTRGDRRLATAGTGDVLSGVIGALLAGGCPPGKAAAAAAWVHGDAARRCGGSPVAGDLPETVAEVVADLLSAAGPSRTEQVED